MINSIFKAHCNSLNLVKSWSTPITYLMLLTLILQQNAFAAESAPDVLVTGFSWLYVLKLVFALVVVIGFFVFFASLMRRYQGFGRTPDNGLSIVASLSMGTRERLVVVQAGQKQVLLGITQTQITSLSELDTPLANPESVDPESFKANLDKILGKKAHGM